MRPDASGYSLLELLFALGLLTTVTAMAVPQAMGTVDEYRAGGAARYFAARAARARAEAVAQSASVGLRISAGSSGYSFSMFVDGNGDGVRSRDIDRGVDPQIAAAERLPDNFSNVDFGVLAGLPAIDSGSAPPGVDPIKLGASNMISFSPGGTASSGTVYIKGRASQYAVRVYGETGRVRLFRYDVRTNQWKQQ
jgi:type II secretory pathway pseudopilin PulG